MSLSQLPPVIAGLKRCLQDDYMRASGDPLRRMIIIQEYAARFKLTGADYLALAFEEVRHAYQNVGGLPEGEYRNGHGDTFTIDDWGKLSSIKKSAPPTPNSTWVPRFFRPTTGPVPPGYHFILGAWDWVPPTPPPDGIPPYHVPAGLEGARYLGVVPSMTQHFQSSGYLPQVSGGGQGSNISAEFGLQQPLAADESSQYPVNLTATNTQQPVPVVSGDAPQHSWVAASTPGQQPAATIAENFEGNLQYSLQKYLDENTAEELVSQETQLNGLENSLLESTMYPGYAPARGYRGPAQ